MMEQSILFGRVPFSSEEEQAIANILKQKLAPSFVCQKTGPAGHRLAYMEPWKLISLANDIFGFNGWSHSVTEQTVDFVDHYHGRYYVGVTAKVKVMLQDGVHHEDIGYGISEGMQSKALSLEKARKESVTDGLKRALKFFGNALGNCLGNKDYLRIINSAPSPEPEKLNVGNFLNENSCALSELRKRIHFRHLSSNVSSSEASRYTHQNPVTVVPFHREDSRLQLTQSPRTDSSSQLQETLLLKQSDIDLCDKSCKENTGPNPVCADMVDWSASRQNSLQWCSDCIDCKSKNINSEHQCGSNTASDVLTPALTDEQCSSDTSDSKAKSTYIPFSELSTNHNDQLCSPDTVCDTDRERSFVDENLLKQMAQETEFNPWPVLSDFTEQCAPDASSNDNSFLGFTDDMLHTSPCSMGDKNKKNYNKKHRWKEEELKSKSSCTQRCISNSVLNTESERFTENKLLDNSGCNVNSTDLLSEDDPCLWAQLMNKELQEAKREEAQVRSFAYNLGLTPTQDHEKFITQSSCISASASEKDITHLNSSCGNGVSTGNDEDSYCSDKPRVSTHRNSEKTDCIPNEVLTPVENKEVLEKETMKATTKHEPSATTGIKCMNDSSMQYVMLTRRKSLADPHKCCRGSVHKNNSIQLSVQKGRSSRESQKCSLESPSHTHKSTLGILMTQAKKRKIGSYI